MNKYFENLNPMIKKYFKILSPEIPDFLYEYIDTPEMMRLDTISALVGSDYAGFIKVKFPYTCLSHSIGVALIVWNFTKDKKQTLAGLFHDIATPAFKHCIDFLNGDYDKQESTEELTTHIIKNSKQIMSLLEKDKIKLEEVNDYKIYPIADNNTPRLAADRLEYTFSDNLVLIDVWDLNDIETLYNNISVLKNEEGIEELGFTNIEIANKFVKESSFLWYFLQSNKDKVKCQFIADIVKSMNKIGIINKDDLYKLTEKQIIQKIEQCENFRISNAFKKFK